MAVAVEPDVAGSEPAGIGPSEAQPSRDVSAAGRSRLAPITLRRIGLVAAAWLLITVIGVGLVVYGMGPMLEERDQRVLLSDYRAEIEKAANEAFGLPGVQEVTEAPGVGDPVAIVEVNAIDFRQVVVEGVGPQQTRRGPGHVPGTAGPGQPGNSAIVGRKSGFGGQFSQLDELGRGDEIVVITTQGRSLYKVTRVGQRHVPRGDEEVFGPSEDDRLTLVTSSSVMPWATNPATVVVAKLDTVAFHPTPQGGRTSDQDGRDRDGSALAPVFLAVLGYACAAAAAVLLYRRTRPRSAYLMSAPLLVVATVLVAEASARLLPAWF
jgi:sortase A